MTVHRTMPSEVEPESLSDLIADCAALPPSLLPRTRVIDLTRLPQPRREVMIPALTTTFVDSYGDYFV
jgi:hypothetical protein